MNQNLIEKQYRQQLPLYTTVQLTLMSELESPNLLRYSGANIYRVTSRIKTLDSLIAKLSRRCISMDEHALDKIGDIVGARIVCLFQEDLERIHHYLSSCGSFRFYSRPEAYIWEGMEWIDKDEFMIERKSSGYGAIHYIAQLSPEVIGENNPAGGIKFELQVRTLMQEAWAALEHSVGYKNSIPDRIHGYFDSAADLLGLIDRAFQRLKNESNRLQKEIGASRLQDSEPINFYTLKQLALEQFGVKLAGRAFSEVLEQLLESSVNTIKAARDCLAAIAYQEGVKLAYRENLGREPAAEDLLRWLPLYSEAHTNSEIAAQVGRRISQTAEYRRFHAKRLLIGTLRGLDYTVLADAIEAAVAVMIIDKNVMIELDQSHLADLLNSEKERLLHGCRQCFGPVLQVQINNIENGGRRTADGG
jgi:ppGpp synthetase/RelA/SpoT-type nucleotidyltranferase